ncbi:MAG: hypothetical protein IKG67_13025 [Parasporobacterium sp.]|nr:hypothetical protein [Parasporobacterium sp.]
MSSKKNSRKQTSSAGRNIASIIFSFLLAVVFTLIGLLMLIWVVRSPEYVTKATDDEYIAYLQAYIEESAADYTLPTSIDVKVLEGIFDAKKIKDDTILEVQALHSGIEFTPDTSSMEDQLTANVQAFFEENGLAVDEEGQEIIDVYVSEIMDIYASSIQIPGLPAFFTLSSQYGRYLLFGLGGAVIFAIILIILCIISQKWAHKGLRYVAYASGGAFLMSLAAPLVLYITGIYKNLQLNPQFLYYGAMNLIRNLLQSFFLVAAVWLVITIILAIIVAALRKRAIHKGHHHHHR